MIETTADGWALIVFGEKILRMEWPPTLADVGAYCGMFLGIYAIIKLLRHRVVRFFTSVAAWYQLGRPAGKLASELTKTIRALNRARDAMESRSALTATVGTITLGSIWNVGVTLFNLVVAVSAHDPFFKISVYFAALIYFFVTLDQHNEDSRVLDIIAKSPGAIVWFQSDYKIRYDQIMEKIHLRSGAGKAEAKLTARYRRFLTAVVLYKEAFEKLEPDLPVAEEGC